MLYPCPQNTFVCTPRCFLTLSSLQDSFRSHSQTSRGNTVPARWASAVIPDQLAWRGKGMSRAMQEWGKEWGQEERLEMSVTQIRYPEARGKQRGHQVQQDLWRKGSVQTLLEQKNFLEHGTYSWFIIAVFGVEFFTGFGFIWYLVAITSQN